MGADISWPPTFHVPNRLKLTFSTSKFREITHGKEGNENYENCRTKNFAFSLRFKKAKTVSNMQTNGIFMWNSCRTWNFSRFSRLWGTNLTRCNDFLQIFWTYRAIITLMRKEEIRCTYMGLQRALVCKIKLRHVWTIFVKFLATPNTTVSIWGTSLTRCNNFLQIFCNYYFNVKGGNWVYLHGFAESSCVQNKIRR
jgi:hypothetical protein